MLQAALRLADWDLRELPPGALPAGALTDRLAEARQGLAGFLDLLTSKAGGSAVKLTLDLPGSGGGDAVRHRVVAFDRRSGRLDLVRPGVARGVLLRDLPPERIGESLYRAALLNDPAQRDALSFLVALEWHGQSAAERQRSETVARRVGLSHRDHWAAELGPLLRARRLLADARSSLDGDLPLTEVRERLVREWRALPRDPGHPALLARLLPGLAEQAFRVDRDWPRMALRGASRWLPDGRLEVRYDWTDPRQVEDFWRVGGGRGGFHFYPDAEPANDPIAELTAADGALRVRGRGYFSHLLQWQGPIQVEVAPAPAWNGPQGVWLLHARLPGHFLALQRLVPAQPLIRDLTAGRVSAPLVAKNGDLAASAKDLRSLPVTMIADRDGARLVAAKQCLAELPPAPSQGSGAWMFLQPWGAPEGLAREAWLAEPSAMAGPVVLRGHVLPERMDAARRRYVASWFELLGGTASAEVPTAEGPTPPTGR